MNNRNQEIAVHLLKMIENDFKIREELAKTGELYQGYHKQMEQIHNQNADELEKIIYEIGWPTEEKVGIDASYAAWLILQHAISKPSLQRKSLPLLQELANQNKIYPREVAMLYDRICYFEMRPQKYGTQFDFDENNNLVPWQIEDINLVEQLRKSVGLPPLEDAIKLMQQSSAEEYKSLKLTYRERLNERIKWAKEIGWL